MGNSIILASGSPRRKELLRMAGVTFRVVSPDVNEEPLLREAPAAMVRRVVNPEGKILGKPVSRAEAVRMLASLQGRDHFVFTGYAILVGDSGRIARSVSRVVKTRVRIRKMGSRDLHRYVSLGESFDKAGAYAAQGFGMSMIEKIHGSYTNVVGLPMAQLLEDLRKLGWRP